MGRKVSKCKNTNRRNTNRRNTKHRNANNRVKTINGYKIIKCLNPHKSYFKYGGSCDELVKDGYTCRKTGDRTNILLGSGTFGDVYLVEKEGVEYAYENNKV